MSSDASGFDWIDAIGYQHEVVHTGVLAWLLEESESRQKLAEILGVESYLETPTIQREARVPGGSRGIVDLLATYQVGSELIHYLPVELKVDSRATREQLERNYFVADGTPEVSGEPKVSGVLLALGVSALCLEQADLTEEQVRSGWTVIGPGRWAAILGDLEMDSQPGLGGYVNRVVREANAHDAAFELANRSGDRPAEIEDVSVSSGRSLEDFAWLREVRRVVADLNSDLPQYLWQTYKNKSGPLMGTFPGDWRGAGEEVFLEFMCTWSRGQHRRELCLKIGGGQGAVSRLREDLVAIGTESGMDVPVRAPRASSGTSTCAKFDASALSAQETAARFVEIQAKLAQVIPALLGHEVSDPTHKES